MFSPEINPAVSLEIVHWRSSSAHEGFGQANTDTQGFALVESEGTCCDPVVRSTVEMAAVVDPTNIRINR